jgi:hypothetical protein
MCNSIGVSIKSEKTQQPCNVIAFMGLELDSVQMVTRLPQDKLIKLRQLLSVYIKRRKITLKDMQSLNGLLNFCCYVVTPCRYFLRRLIDLTNKVIKPNHRITLHADSRKDIKAWQIFGEYFNGKKYC